MKSIATLACALPLAASAELRSLSLFDGEDLAAWIGDGYVVEDGTLVCTPEGRNLVTRSIFANYAFDFEFKLPPGGNNGIGILYPGEGDAAYTGIEVQILDNGAEQYADLLPAQYHGSLYKLAAAKEAPLKPTGEWNQERIVVNGSQVQVTLNGELINQADLDELNRRFPDHAGARHRAGHLALCGHGDPVAFRNLRIAEMPPAANDAGAAAAGFVRIFDGESLDGWRAAPGDEGHWVPLNGILKYDGRSESKDKDLWSEKEYGDFTLAFDWRWSAPGPVMKRPVIGVDGRETGKQVEVQELDSGIYLRGSSKSQVNLWNWPCGSGEVYGYRTDPDQPAEVVAGVTPRAKADKPVGEWNRMLITMKGDRLSVSLNGLEVIREATLPGVARKGRIALQHHGTPIDFANLWIKEL
ncbi:3-keto-disaccharide hydrolase [Haloferula sargassicola]|uniref:3-keto-alpha-glucoside-1,2-lyase/3-keto-2-hydroxy-glucal hydratase domain-containing protein n=1 Tax=Haloferula sargassicola TaxID=490096 RepID=A0ABP9UT35_9BACT